jgi:hypothetical protein
MKLFLPKPEGDEQNAELYKHRLALRALILDKLILALFFLVLGYVVNRSLEAYKSGLQKDLEQFKSEQSNLAALTRSQQEQALAQQQQSYARELSDLRSLQERALAQQEQSYARELSNLSSQQDKQLEVLRTQEEQNSEALRVLLNTQSQLAARRVVAYENVWRAYGILFNQVGRLQPPMFGDDLPPGEGSSIKAATRTFEETFEVETIFLDTETTSEIDGILDGLSLAANSSSRGQAVLQTVYHRMRGFERLYRDRMENTLSKSPALPSR